MIVAAYNAAATLGQCLSSIRELNYPDYETILVDDGSTDTTSEIAAQAGLAPTPDASFLAAHLARPVLQIDNASEFLAALPIEVLAIS